MGGIIGAIAEENRKFASDMYHASKQMQDFRSQESIRKCGFDLTKNKPPQHVQPVTTDKPKRSAPMHDNRSSNVVNDNIMLMASAAAIISMM